MTRLHFFLTFLISFSLLHSNDLKNPGHKIRHRAEYVYSVDDETVIALPSVTLKGKILRYTFPGPPNYEKIEDGDSPEIRWILEISTSEIQKLKRAKFIPQNEVSYREEKEWVQLIPPNTEQDPLPFLNKQVVVEGYLGTLAFHVHSVDYRACTIVPQTVGQLYIGFKLGGSSSGF